MSISKNYINTTGKTRPVSRSGNITFMGSAITWGWTFTTPASVIARSKPGMVITVEPGIYIPEEKLGYASRTMC